MGTTLTGTTPQDTYDSLIKVTDNGPLSGSLKTLTDGLGNDSALALSTGAASVTGNLTVTGAASAYTGGALEIQGTANAIKTFYLNRYGVASGSQHRLRAQNAYFEIASANSEPIALTGGNVGIGTSSPDTLLTLGSVPRTENTAGIKIFRGGSTTDYATYGFAGNAVINAVGVDLVLQRQSTEVARFTTAGLCFGGDYLAANALDDYEEGTFTFTVAPTTSGTITLTADQRTARYTKIGRQVSVQAYLIVASVSSPVGTRVSIEGLPFTIANSFSAGCSATVTFSDASSSYARTALASIALQNSTTIIADIDASTIATSDELFVNITYTV